MTRLPWTWEEGVRLRNLTKTKNEGTILSSNKDVGLQKSSIFVQILQRLKRTSLKTSYSQLGALFLPQRDIWSLTLFSSFPEEYSWPGNMSSQPCFLLSPS